MRPIRCPTSSSQVLSVVIQIRSRVIGSRGIEYLTKYARTRGNAGSDNASEEELTEPVRNCRLIPERRSLQSATVRY